MKRNLEYAINESFQFLQKPVVEKTILFIEENGNTTRGDCQAILDVIVQREDFRDWKFYWTSADNNILEHEIQNFSDKRIIPLVIGSVGFREIIETVSVIVSSVLLPRYYIKRAGQKVISLLGENHLRSEGLVRQPRVQLHMMLSKSDVVVLDDEAEKELIDEWYGSRTPFRMMIGYPPRFMNLGSAKKDIMISLSLNTLGGTFADLENRYKSVKLCGCGVTDSIGFRIPYAMWELFQKENNPEVLEASTPSSMPFVNQIGNRSIVITDKKPELKETLTVENDCIYISNNFLENEEQQDDPHFFMTDSWESALQSLKTLLTQKRTSVDRCDVIRDAACQGVEWIVDQIRTPGITEEKFRNDAVLFSFAGSLNRKIWKLLSFCDFGERVNVLIRETDKNAIWKSKQILDDQFRVFCRTGGGARTNEALITEEDFANEYRRIMGNNQYRRIIHVGKMSDFWKSILTHGTENEIEEMTQQEFFEYVLNHYNSELFSTKRELSELFQAFAVNGEDHYLLGNQNNQYWFLKKKGHLTEPILVFVDNQNDVQPALKLVKENPNRTFFMIDRNNILKEEEQLKNDQVYVIPTRVKPVRLILAAETIAFCKDPTLNTIFSYLGKQLILQEESHGMLERIGSGCGLLAVEDVNVFY